MGKLSDIRTVFVCGPERSGTTWVGTILGLAKDTEYLHEPHAPDYHKDVIPSSIETIGGEAFPVEKVPNPTKDIEMIITMIGKLGPWELDDALDEWIVKKVRKYKELLVRHHVWAKWRYQPDNLIIKVPSTVKIEMYIKAYNPSHIIYLVRHPMGILNSFTKRGWMKDYAFKLWIQFCGLPGNEQYSVLSDPIERLITIIHVRYNYVRELQKKYNLRMVSYEDLCEDPYENFGGLFDWLELKCTQDLMPYIEPEEVDNHNLSVIKNSLERMNAWQHELSDEDLKIAKEFIEYQDLPYDFV